MKKQRLALLAACLIVLVFTCITIVTSNDHKARSAAAQTTAVQSLQSQLKTAQATQKAHDAVNNTAIKNAGNQIILLTQQKTTLCNQIKAARLAQSLCQ